MRDDLAHAVANKLSIDLITGEVDRGKRALILEATRIAYEAIPSFSNLKVQGREALGLRMDDYRTFDKVHKVKIQEAL
jgi:surface antigen